MFQDLVACETPIIKYLLTYKFSQDHIELFFGAVRSCGGFNNNPTSQQFTAAYKRLLMRSSIQGGIGNCQPDATALLHSFDDVIEVNNETITLSEVALMRKYDIAERKPMQSDHDYADTPNFVKLSEFKEAAISYISKYEILSL